MSSKGKSSGEAGSGAELVPSLRFPEFKDAEGWALSPMGEVYSFRGNNSLSRDKLNYSSGTVRNIHYGDIHTKFSSHFILIKETVPFVNEAELDSVRESQFCAEGDLVFADASEDLADIGKCIEIIDLSDNKTVAGLHTILARPAKQMAVGFGGHLFQSGLVRRQIQREAQGAKVLGISPRRLQDIRLPLPSLPEQQKIADCLDSANALIAAQGRKVEALKAHKKGLMQQLFPQEGETQPRLRFPEFEGAGKWKEVPLGKFIEEFRDQSTVQDEYEVLTSARSGLVRQRDYYDNDHLTERNNIGFNVIPPNYMTYRSRSDDRTFYFNENNLGITGVVSVYYPVFRIQGGTNKFFIELFSAFSKLIGMYSVGTSQTVLSLNQLKKLKLPVPGEAEQQRIADCLTSLDDVIAAEAQKLDTLKTHKKGLMQQLFPQIGEDDA